MFLPYLAGNKWGNLGVKVARNVAKWGIVG